MPVTAFSTMSARPDLRTFLPPQNEETDPVRLFFRLLDAIKTTATEFDDFCSTQPHILRDLRGHAFEVWFDELMTRSGHDCMKVGGDDVVDRRLSGHTLQLKTPFWNGTVQGEVVQYKMHKTHGSEKYPDVLYLPLEFAEFFVGLHPDGGLIICPANVLTTRQQLNPNLPWGEYIADPVPFDWNTPWLNRYDLLGIDRTKLVFPDPPTSDILPKISRAIGHLQIIGDLQIIKAIMSEENFRVLEQNIVGSIREFHLMKFVQKNGIELKEPTELETRSRQKVDKIYWQEPGRRWLRIQIKGLTKGLCHGRTLGCETQGSHGRIPARLYKRTDFEILAIVIDPKVIPRETAEKLSVEWDAYNFLFVRMSDLPLHPRSSEWGEEYIKSSFSFDVGECRLNNFNLLPQF